jgi:hypothetical protein
MPSSRKDIHFCGEEDMSLRPFVLVCFGGCFGVGFLGLQQRAEAGTETSLVPSSGVEGRGAHSPISRAPVAADAAEASDASDAADRRAALIHSSIHPWSTIAPFQMTDRRGRRPLSLQRSIDTRHRDSERKAEKRREGEEKREIGGVHTPTNIHTHKRTHQTHTFVFSSRNLVYSLLIL